VEVNPCQLSIASRQVAYRRDDIHIGKVATNMQNRQLWTADKGFLTALELDEGLKTLNRSDINMVKNAKLGFRLGHTIPP
jgi:hypothetical protein